MNKRRIISAKTIQPKTSGTHIRPPSTKYLIKNEKKVPGNKRTPSRPVRKNTTRPTSKNELAAARLLRANRRVQAQQTPKPSPIPKFTFSGTIIYDGRYALNPYKWAPEAPENQPEHLKWSNLSPGTQVLDKNTHLVWIVEEGHKLGLAPCQTIKVDLNVPKNLANFNPNKCINPFLPDIRQIPIGTQFIFKNSAQVFRLNQHLHLESASKENLRPPQVIPISINSLFNTQQLVGLDHPVMGSSLQRPTRDGYHTLEEWLTGMIPGSETRPGFLGDLPKLSDLQPGDVLHFYDPHTDPNPQQHGLNPDGSIYLDGFHESKHFTFKLLLLFNETQSIIGIEIQAPPQATLATVNIPIESTDQGKSIYIRSTCLIPNNGDPVVLVNEMLEPYEMPKDAARLQVDLKEALGKAGYPFTQIKVGYLGKESKAYVWRWANLPDHITGVVMSSDAIPANKFGGSGRFWLGFSGQYGGQMYRTQLKSRLEDVVIDEVYVDGIKLDLLEDGVLFESNEQISEWLQAFNSKMPEVGYSGYSVNLWWSENPDRLYLYLNGVRNNLLPEIMMKMGEDLIPLSFEPASE